MNKFKDKYISIIGDSISTFEAWLPAGYPSFYTVANSCFTGVYGARETWWGRVLKHFGAELLVNNSWSGSYVCKPPYCEIESYGCSNSRACGLDADGIVPDHVIAYIGTNDRGAGFPPTSDDKSDLSVFENAYREMLVKIKNTYPSAEIWCCTFPKTTCKNDPCLQLPEVWKGVPIEEHREIIRRVAKAANCHIIELTGGTCDTSDGLHPNYEGMEYIADKVIEAMAENI